MSDTAEPTRIRREVEIVNRLGLHARAAARFVSTAGHYDADIQVTRDERTVNGKSIMGMMMLAAAQGSCILIEAEGSDAAQAMEALEALIAERFGEDS
ncbi:HPr-like protein Crh [wastewater metagenome]|uniref:HPr-like protein Crh n=2 Tax=unclassified sequences TaxID=12908 RepID=A0A5B8RDX7_9ZZZZ|nr:MULTISPECIES: HPr family phosphocarrier protein [Arhodomonas]MCS4504746.1 HPr family phosphocarrier protein [Arhodomonas aquaeolei]QEA04937.1 HPr-like protein Crh [uncultured organism]